MLYCAEKCESVGVRGCKRARDGAEPNDLLVCVPVVDKEAYAISP